MTKTFRANKKIILATILVSETKCAMNANSTQSTIVQKVPRATIKQYILSYWLVDCSLVC